MEQTLERPAGTVLRRAELMLELWRMGVALPRLGFLQWLVENGRDPEWQLDSPVPLERGKAHRRDRRRRALRAADPPLRAGSDG